MTARPAWGVVLGLMAGQALVLYLLSRVWICACGTIRFWVGDIHSSELLQQHFRLVTPSHVIHGMIFYGVLHLVLPRTPVLVRLAIAASRSPGRSPRTRPG